MDKILLWDSDPSLRKALVKALSWKGFHPVALEDPSKLSKALELERPELSLLEGAWEPGARISLDGESYPLSPNGELSSILPSFKVTQSGKLQADGIILGNLRKPFGIEDLFSNIRSSLLIKDRLEKTPLPWEEYLEVRRLRTEEEILSALKLRYKVYQEIGYINQSPEEIEFDKYDPRSIIFGAFFRHNGTKELAGTLRIIRSNDNGPHYNELKNILRHRSLECSEAPAYEKSSLPACESFGVAPRDISRFFPGFGSTFSERGINLSSEICELSRLVIRRKYRRHRFGIERKLYNSVIVDCCAEEPKRNWFAIAVHPSNGSKYARYGFNMISSLGIKPYTSISQPAILMAWDLQQYLLTPNPFTKDLALNTLVYKENGCLLSTLGEKASYPVQA
ncbi:MAG TPA: hypothetical protein VM123_09245 [archaeon]|nr:hypothetical protein [archaeon]